MNKLFPEPVIDVRISIKPARRSRSRGMDVRDSPVDVERRAARCDDDPPARARFLPVLDSDGDDGGGEIRNRGSPGSCSFRRGKSRILAALPRRPAPPPRSAECGTEFTEDPKLSFA